MKLFLIFLYFSFFLGIVMVKRKPVIRFLGVLLLCFLTVIVYFYFNKI